jgi:hypothetical protein
MPIASSELTHPMSVMENLSKTRRPDDPPPFDKLAKVRSVTGGTSGELRRPIGFQPGGVALSLLSGWLKYTSKALWVRLIIGSLLMKQESSILG